MPVALDPHLQFDISNLKVKGLDINGDGIIDANDCPYPHGTQAAKKWWYNYLDPWVKTQITDDMREQYGDKVTGAYKGKPLVPGVAGKGQADFQFMVDKIRVTQGLSLDAANRIAGKVFWKKYG